MPFDGAYDEVREVLVEARRLLETKGVCYGVFRDRRGRLCSAEAITRAAKNDGALIVFARDRFIQANGIAPGVLAIETWHDTRVFWWKRFFYRNRPPIEILSGFDQAIALRA